MKFNKIIILFLTMMLLLSSCSSTSNPKITKMMYDKIETGMTLEDVEKVLGKGEELVKAQSGEIIVDNYQWENKDGSSLHIVFQNGVANAKSQYGLK